MTVTATSVAGRPAAVVETLYETQVARAVLTHAPWGDLLIAGSTGPAASVPGVDGLAAMLASARQATPEEWEALAVEAAGGPGLHADEGAAELERGTVAGAGGEVEWLLQSWSGALDPCLKLATRQRACVVGSSSSTGVAFGTGGGGDEGGIVPEFVMATIDRPGARLRVTTPAGTAEGTLHPLATGAHWGGVVFADGAHGAYPVCGGIGPGSALPRITVEVLDEAGAVVGCVSLAGDVVPR